jgi:hypothetical protein
MSEINARKTKTEFGGITEQKSKFEPTKINSETATGNHEKHLVAIVESLNEVTGLNLEIERQLSFIDAKTMKYQVTRRISYPTTESYGFSIESYSDSLTVKQLIQQLSRMEIFARQLRGAGKLNPRGVSA